MRETEYSAQLSPTGTTLAWSDGQSPVIVGAAQELFGADFSRQGRDLVLTFEDAPPLRVVDYFAGTPVPLRGADGGELSGEVVSSLAGPLAPGEYAQSGGAVTGVPIGQVERLVGASSVQRADGTVETLQVGMPVFENDVVATEPGANLSLTFADGTIFTLSGASRMVLTQMLYDPAGSSNSAIFNLVQGSFVFIAGQVAKTGGIEVTTPAATMGVRGTTVRVDVDVLGAETIVTCTLNPDPDGSIGQIEIRDLDGNFLTNVTGHGIEMGHQLGRWRVAAVAARTR